MATVLVLTHPNDLFRSRHFLAHALFPHWADMGHRVIVHEGTANLPGADVVLLHVDRTVVPDEYIEALGHPADSILAAAQQSGAGLIVLGARHLSLAQRLLGQSVSDDVSHPAPCDVLIVH